MIERAIKRGGSRQFQTEYINGYTKVPADEVDADLNIVFDAVNAGGAGPAGGDLDGTYPDPTITAHLRARIPPEITMPEDQGKALIVQPNGFPGWMPAPTGGPTGPAGGDLTGSYPDPGIADGTITTAKLADIAVTTEKLATGAVLRPKIDPTIIPRAPNFVDIGKVLTVISGPAQDWVLPAWKDTGTSLEPWMGVTYPIAAGTTSPSFPALTLTGVGSAAIPGIKSVRQRDETPTTPLLAADVLAQWHWYGASPAGLRRAAALSAQAAENWDSVGVGTSLIFETVPNRSNTSQSRLEIQANGYTKFRNTTGVRIGDNTDPRERLDVAGAVVVAGALATVPGTIDYDGTHFRGRTATAWVNLDVSGGPPSGPAGGVLAGTYPNPALAPINKLPLEVTTLTASNTISPMVGSYLLVDASAGPVQLTLPTAPANGYSFYVVKVDGSANAVSVALATGGEQIGSPGGIAGAAVSWTEQYVGYFFTRTGAASVAWMALPLR